mmetsp:Transcript_20412/g.63116  ORF Transcript_20412/g.63116 Transcript_20412/m.63116 type:complete len:221 (+) Transcript_20412:244-906(+)
MCNCGTPLYGGAFWVDDDDEDWHEALRSYARRELGAPEDPWAAAMNSKVTSETFGPTFRRVLERNGWPVLKCGNGKGLKRCLMVDASDSFTWGSKKRSNETSVHLSDIKAVSFAAFHDGPPGANERCMLLFNVNDTHGIKVLAETPADAIVLQHGFATLLSHPSFFNLSVVLPHANEEPTSDPRPKHRNRPAAAAPREEESCSESNENYAIMRALFGRSS